MFTNFKIAVQKQFDRMKQGHLFAADVSKDLLWDTYLSSFPEGSNPIFRERTEHDCQCCKSFIRKAGNIVAIIDGKKETIWDCDIDGTYKVVADALSTLVKSKPIDNIFLHDEKQVGVDQNHQMLESGEVCTWNHFFIELPKKCIEKSDNIGTRLSNSRATYDVFLRSLNEITIDAIDTVLDLIGQNSLYRGEENRFAIEEFRIQKTAFMDILDTDRQEFFCWLKFHDLSSSVSKIRNTAIGTLLIDLSEGKDLEYAVKSFEAKVAPTNYKRPTALITKSMIQGAQKKVEELGFTTALERRFAVTEDITINNVLFADRESKKAMNVFDDLEKSAAPAAIKKLDKVEEVSIDTFIENILPTAQSLELMVENLHSGNFVSLIAPVDPDSKTMFKWHNNFSWAYAGELADSIKERVKNAGGKVDGDLRCSLSWFNYDDLDLHLVEPNGTHIFFRNKLSQTGGNLDVDMNAGGRASRTPVENICYPDRKRMKEGEYLLYVNNFNKRETRDVGFEVEIEFDGRIYSFSYPKAVANRTNVIVAKFEYTHKSGIKFIESLPSTQASKQVWGINTHQFEKVKMVMFSPNYWDEKATGNRHYFFMLENCINPLPARGFFNEFLTDDLRDHRKVFEVLGSKMKTPESDNQLSGIGFSTTQRNHVFCKVKGNFTRTIKIIF